MSLHWHSSYHTLVWLFPSLSLWVFLTLEITWLLFRTLFFEGRNSEADEVPDRREGVLHFPTLLSHPLPCDQKKREWWNRSVFINIPSGMGRIFLLLCIAGNFYWMLSWNSILKFNWNLYFWVNFVVFL